MAGSPARLGPARLGPARRADLRGADLRGTSLQHATLAGAHLEQSLLAAGPVPPQPRRAAILAAARWARAITDSIGLTPLAVGNSEASAT